MSLASLPRDIICNPYTFCFCYEGRFVQKVVKIVCLTHDMLQSVIVSGAVIQCTRITTSYIFLAVKIIIYRAKYACPRF